MLSQYIWFGLVSGPAPKFKPTLKRDELPPEVITLEGFREILSKFYVEQHIGRMWVQVQPVYNHEIDRFTIRFRKSCSWRRIICGRFRIRAIRERFRSSSSRWWGGLRTFEIFGITTRLC